MTALVFSQVQSLVAFLTRNMTIEEATLRLVFFCIGFSPIASLSLSAFELMPLHFSGPLVVFPAILLAVFLSGRYPKMGQLFLQGLIVGLIAVALYDAFRLPFVFTGYFKDFIPKIGNYLFNTTNVHWSVGYTWRYLGNGGGMGMAFCMLVPFFPSTWQANLKRTGTIYGVIIYACLLATIYLSPAGTTYLFTPSLFTGFIALIGHVIFGFVLGWVYPIVFSRAAFFTERLQNVFNFNILNSVQS